MPARYPLRRRFGRFGDAGGAVAPPASVASPYTGVVPVGANPIPYLSNQGLADAADQLGYQEYVPQSGVEENQGNPYPDNLPGQANDLQRPLDPGIDTPSFVNPYRTVMYSITGLDTAVPLRALTGNPKRTYLLVQNLGPGNMFLGIGTDPIVGGANVLNLVTTQIYEQIGGGVYLPPNPWYPEGISLSFSYVSPEYISLLTDTAGTTAMILEGSFVPPPAAAGYRGY